MEYVRLTNRLSQTIDAYVYVDGVPTVIRLDAGIPYKAIPVTDVHSASDSLARQGYLTYAPSAPPVPAVLLTVDAGWDGGLSVMLHTLFQSSGDFASAVVTVTATSYFQSYPVAKNAGVTITLPASGASYHVAYTATDTWGQSSTYVILLVIPAAARPYYAPNSLLLGTSAGVYSYSGTDWRRVTALPAVYSCIARDPTTGRILVSTPSALYASEDNGVTWVDQTPLVNYSGPAYVFSNGGSSYLYGTGGGNGNLRTSSDLRNWSSIRSASYFQQASSHGNIAYSADSNGNVGVLDLTTGSESLYAPGGSVASAEVGFSELFVSTWSYFGGSTLYRFNLSTWVPESPGFTASGGRVYRMFNAGRGKLFCSLEAYGESGIALAYLDVSTTDSVTWSSCSLPPAVSSMGNTASGSANVRPYWDSVRGKYVATCGGHGNVVESSDGVTWTEGVPFTSGYFDAHMGAVPGHRI